MATREAFEQALEEDPLDEVTHKVFADWLEENDHCEEAALHRKWTIQAYEDALDTLSRYARQFHMDCREELIQKLKAALPHGGSIYTGDWEEGLSDWDRQKIWEAFAAVTCIPVPQEARENLYTRCAC